MILKMTMAWQMSLCIVEISESEKTENLWVLEAEEPQIQILEDHVVDFEVVWHTDLVVETSLSHLVEAVEEYHPSQDLTIFCLLVQDLLLLHLRSEVIQEDFLEVTLADHMFLEDIQPIYII